MNMTSGFFNNRDLSQLKREELEDLDHHLQNRQRGLNQRMDQMRRDLEALEHDRRQIEQLLTKTRSHA